MIRRFLTLLLLATIGVALIAFEVANRKAVSVSLDPFDQAEPAVVFSPPLYLLIFGALISGVLIGGCAAWLQQRKWRIRARRAEAEARALRAQVGTAPSASALPPYGERLRLIVPPPAA
ncbi:MAG TPA: lipopolysaccharide assembly protein LapA domain-containing protein [Xanthobacteraceae bacterium]|nr:lipopolysaccharide assembly protein LapA domain-containing protein [Xanthobacteraceae bacterium]